MTEETRLHFHELGRKSAVSYAQKFTNCGNAEAAAVSMLHHRIEDALSALNRGDAGRHAKMIVEVQARAGLDLSELFSAEPEALAVFAGGLMSAMPVEA